ncbi:glycosyltransferase family 39 protein [bacterium]|nr:glycosyltransferase family 39 protein [bacterium]
MFRKKALFFIILFAFVLRSGFVLFYFDEHKFYGYEYGTNDTHRPIGDDQRYIEIAMNLIDGNGFPVIYEKPPHSQDFRRGPLYLLFLASIFKIFGFNVLMICLTQALVSSLSIYFICKIADHYFGKKTAFISALIWTVYPATILWTMAIYRETLTIFLILWTTWSFIRLRKKQTWRYSIISGSALSMLLLLDPFTQVLIPVYLIFLWVTPQFIDPLRTIIYRYWGAFYINTKRKLLISGLVIGTAVLLLLPWLM